MRKDKMIDFGVIIGRFQVPELTEAHLELIKEVKKECMRLVVVIGITPTLGTKRNPLGYIERVHMIHSVFPDAMVTHVADNKSDEEWSKALDSSLRALCPIGSICFYGGDDSFINAYSGKFKTKKIDIESEQRGTLMRKHIGKQPIDDLSFRKGIIYSCENQFPRVYPTIDVAIWKYRGTGTNKAEVLMGRKNINQEFSFIGGFIDPTDENCEMAVCRELYEEVELMPDNKITYIGSFLVNDWRYKHEERIMTMFYAVRYIAGTGHPKEEFYETKWIAVHEGSLELVTDSHKPLFHALIQKGGKKWRI